MDFNPNNPIVQYCLEGMTREDQGNPEEASRIYRQAWDNLDEAARRVLVMMPLVTENGGALDYLANMSGLEPGELRHVLERLVTLNLVDRRGDLRTYRYTIHGLTRAFLQQQVVRWGM